MEALIPKLFILSAEASIVLFLILIVMIVFNSKAKRKDIHAAKEMVHGYVKNKDERVSSLKNQLQKIGFNGNHDEQAEKLYEKEKTLIKEFVSLYLQHDTYRLLDYPENIIEVDNHFLKTTGAANASTAEATVDSSEEKANAAILAREQEESNGEQLKELSELRLKNTELNEHLFEALETITELMTEHGKKTGQEVDSNAQKVLEAIIYLRDKRLDKQDEPDNTTSVTEQNPADMSNNDATLDDSTIVNLDLEENLDADLDEDNVETGVPAEEDDPWADALSEQAEAEAATEQASQETPAETESPVEEDDPWADALAEQAGTDAKTDEADPWADALAEQATAEASEKEDPWAEALAEQEASEKNS